MKNHKSVSIFAGALMLAVGMSGCTTTPHSTEAFLLNEKRKGEFSLAASEKSPQLNFGNNPIYGAIVKSGV